MPRRLSEEDLLQRWESQMRLDAEADSLSLLAEECREAGWSEEDAGAALEATIGAVRDIADGAILFTSEETGDLEEFLGMQTYAEADSGARYSIRLEDGKYWPGRFMLNRIDELDLFELWHSIGFHRFSVTARRSSSRADRRRELSGLQRLITADFGFDLGDDAPDINYTSNGNILRVELRFD